MKISLIVSSRDEIESEFYCNDDVDVDECFGETLNLCLQCFIFTQKLPGLHIRV